MYLCWCCPDLHQDGNCLGLNASQEPEVSSQNSVTRKAGGRREVEKQVQVQDLDLFYALYLFSSSTMFV